jgi:hypothetical protein
MFRSTSSVLALLAAMTVPSLGADYGSDWGDDGSDVVDFRSGYPIEPGDWAGLGDDDDPIAIETGIRYWYARGSQSFTSSGSTVSATDTAHIGELHLRIEDHSTNSYAAAIAGYSMAMSGDVTTPMGTTAFTDGHVGYLGGDIGWQAWSDNNGTGVGPMAGYLYWEDAPDTGRFSFTTLNSGDAVAYDPATGQTFLPGDSEPNAINAHVLRLGISGKAKIGDIFDVTATVAGVPYARVRGTAGVDDPTFSTAEYAGPAQPPYGTELGNISSIRSSTTSIDGWGYGAMVEGFIGVRPVEQLTVRVGGRLWYLQGTADATYDRAFITDPGPPGGPYNVDPIVVEQGYISTNNPFRMLRYGLMLEATYAF